MRAVRAPHGTSRSRERRPRFRRARVGWRVGGAREPLGAALVLGLAQRGPEPPGAPVPGADELLQIVAVRRAPLLERPRDGVDLTVEVLLGGRRPAARGAAHPR